MSELNWLPDAIRQFYRYIEQQPEFFGCCSIVHIASSLYSQTLSLLLVGEFKRGKTSILNMLKSQLACMANVEESANLNDPDIPFPLHGFEAWSKYDQIWMVLSASQALSAYEAMTIRKLCKHFSGKVGVILNKCDFLSENDFVEIHTRILRFLEEIKPIPSFTWCIANKNKSIPLWLKTDSHIVNFINKEIYQRNDRILQQQINTIQKFLEEVQSKFDILQKQKKQDNLNGQTLSLANIAESFNQEIQKINQVYHHTKDYGIDYLKKNLQSISEKLHQISWEDYAEKYLNVLSQERQMLWKSLFEAIQKELLNQYQNKSVFLTCPALEYYEISPNFTWNIAENFTISHFFNWKLPGWINDKITFGLGDILIAIIKWLYARITWPKRRKKANQAIAPNIAANIEKLNQDLQTSLQELLNKQEKQITTELDSQSNQQKIEVIQRYSVPPEDTVSQFEQSLSSSWKAWKEWKESYV